MSITVVGGGLSGLTTALELSGKYEVKIVAREFGMNTHSHAAAAVWHVCLVGAIKPDITTWARDSLIAFTDLAKTTPESGVEIISGLELFRSTDSQIPEWLNWLDQFESLSAEDLKSYPGIRRGYRMRVPAASMNIYLPWLEDRVREAGVTFCQAELGSFSEIAKDSDLIVNCSGLGAAGLSGDADLVPIRGQYLVIEAPQRKLLEYIGDDENPNGMAYLIERSGELVIGGTSEFGSSTLEFCADPDAMLERATTFLPEYRSLDITKCRKVVGLRPHRTSGIKLDYLMHGEIPLVNNYGHGGSGFSLSWGCARAVRRLIDEHST